jgi:hypothetical protein
LRRLAELTASARRIAFVGLAKNTGKTEAMTALLGELVAAGEVVGVTSIGRDGEERDAIDPLVEKPPIPVEPGTIVATTDLLLDRGGAGHRPLERTHSRTPLGPVVMARMLERGRVEVAGPSTTEDVRAVAARLLELGAARVLVDGALDRRFAASPGLADAVVLSSGAVLHREIDEVVRRTADAVELMRLPEVEDRTVRRLATAAGTAPVLVCKDYAAAPLARRTALAGSALEVAALLRREPGVRWILVPGALTEPFLAGVLDAASRREIGVVVADGTRVFLPERGYGWYRRQGLRIEVLRRTALGALAVNPVAPRSHRFGAVELRTAIESAIPGLPVVDVRDPAYPSPPPARPAPGPPPPARRGTSACGRPASGSDPRGAGRP